MNGDDEDEIESKLGACRAIVFIAVITALAVLGVAVITLLQNGG